MTLYTACRSAHRSLFTWLYRTGGLGTKKRIGEFVSPSDWGGPLRTGGPLLASDALELQHCPDAAIGFGKKYPEFWINKREAMVRVADDSGVHICLRAPDVPSVDAFHAAALKAGGASDGDPAVRMHYDEGYYAAFIRDPDGNRIEAVRFLRSRI
jgi:catechol 2,3-dioxygenase-like lactoylglutathione lyase family enzyme